MIKSFRANKPFIAASVVNSKLGIACTNIHEEGLRKAGINSSGTSIMLVDSYKFGDIKIVHSGELEDFNLIITSTKMRSQAHFHSL